MRDLYHNLAAELALAPAVQADAIAGPAIHLVGSERVAVVVSTGAFAGSGNFGAKLQESDIADSGGFADVPVDLVDSDAPATLAASSTYKLGYRGYKPYVRLALTKASGTSIAAGAVAVLAVNRRPAA